MDIRYHANIFLRGLRVLVTCFGALLICLAPLILALFFVVSSVLSIIWISCYFGFTTSDEVIPFSGYAIPVFLAFIRLMIYDLGIE